MCPGDRNRVLLPLVFCRECGQEYYCVNLEGEAEGRSASPRQLSDVSKGEDGSRQSCFLYLSTDAPWPENESEVIERLPEEWLEEHHDAVRVRYAYRDKLPQAIRMAPNGTECSADRPDGICLTLVPAPFRFCLRCGVSYGSSRMGDYMKLATLATEGRSTATTILSLSAVRHLRRDGTLPPDARKLLSFTDNRQDASLQAGHFNDFVEVGLLRAALYKAVSTAGRADLSHDLLEQAVFRSLQNMGVNDTHYAREPGLLYAVAEQTNAAMRSVLSYRIYRDQERGWRITAPNLEQCGLLVVDYLSLAELCADPTIWNGRHEALVGAGPETGSVSAGHCSPSCARSLQSEWMPWTPWRRSKSGAEATSASCHRGAWTRTRALSTRECSSRALAARMTARRFCA